MKIEPSVISWTTAIVAVLVIVLLQVWKRRNAPKGFKDVVKNPGSLGAWDAPFQRRRADDSP